MIAKLSSLARTGLMAAGLAGAFCLPASAAPAGLAARPALAGGSGSVATDIRYCGPIGCGGGWNGGGGIYRGGGVYRNGWNGGGWNGGGGLRRGGGVYWNGGGWNGGGVYRGGVYRGGWNGGRYYGNRVYSRNWNGAGRYYRGGWNGRYYRGPGYWGGWNGGWGGWGPGYGSGIYLGFGGLSYGIYDPWRYAPPVRPVYRAGGGHVQWCYNRYRSYRAWDNTFQPNHGPRRECLSPYR